MLSMMSLRIMAMISLLFRTMLSWKSVTNFLTFSAVNLSSLGFLSLVPPASPLMALKVGSSLSPIPKYSRIILKSSSSVLTVTNSILPLFFLACSIMIASLSSWSSALAEENRTKISLLPEGSL